MNQIQVQWDFQPRPYQMPSMKALPNGNRRIVKVWHRRSGKDLCEVNRCGTESQKVVGIYYHMFPELSQGRKILWDGMDNEGKRFLDYIPKSLINGKPNETEMQIEFNNGSIYQVIGADRMSWIGTNPRGVVLSEYQRQDPKAWDYMRPILRANKGWAVFCYTPLGHNHGHKLFQMAKSNPAWHCEVKTVLDTFKSDGTRIITDEDIEAERREGMDEALIQQEYFCSFEGSLQGSFYGEYLKEAREQNRVTVFNHDPNLPVITAWDIGIGAGDACAIGFYQRLGREHRMIDYHEENGKDVAHFARLLQQKSLERKYRYEMIDGHVLCIAPHDASSKSFGSGKTTAELARENGLHFRVLKKLSIQEGIQAVRRLFPDLWINERYCERMIDVCSSYHKEWDEVKQEFSNVPVHDWSSHGADQLRYYALGSRDETSSYRPALKAVTSFNPLADDEADYQFNPFDEVRA